jgi:hypothetical protein
METKAGDLTPRLFGEVRAAMGYLGPYALNRRLVAIRSVFNWAKGEKWIAEIPEYGGQFELATKADIR